MGSFLETYNDLRNRIFLLKPPLQSDLEPSPLIRVTPKYAVSKMSEFMWRFLNPCIRRSNSAVDIRVIYTRKNKTRLT